MNPRMYQNQNKTASANAGAKITEKKDYSVFKNGSVTEVTLGDSTFQVADVHRLESMFQKITFLENRMYDQMQQISTLQQSVNALAAQLSALNVTLQQIKNERKDDGFGSREMSY